MLLLGEINVCHSGKKFWLCIWFQKGKEIQVATMILWLWLLFSWFWAFIAINRLLKCMSQFYWCSFTTFSTGDTVISQEILILSSQTCTTKCGTLFVSLRVVQWRSSKDTTATVSNTRHAREFCAACGAFWYISNISHLRYLVILVYSKCVQKCLAS